MIVSSYTPKEVLSFMGLIDTYRRWSEYEQYGSRKYFQYHPSEWGRCLRAQQYKHYTQLGYINVEFVPKESKLLRLFDKGHNMHNRWSSYFEDMGVVRGRWKCANRLCQLFLDSGKMIEDMDHHTDGGQSNINKILQENKSRIYGEEERQGCFRPEKCVCGCTDFEYLETHVRDESINMKGNADLILDCSKLTPERFKGVRTTFDPRFLPKDGQIAVADMKSIGQSAWDFQLVKKGAHPYYIIQIIIYIHILNVDYGLIIYENKNNSELQIYKVERNDKWWEIIKWQASTMMSMVADKKLPPPRYEKSSYDCKGCEFKSLCHKSKVWADPKLKSKKESFYRELL